jgi:ATP/maltotriose-dependent transcriptional regulator MalT
MHLRELGEEAATQQRHFDWICALAEKAGTWDATQAQAFKRMSGERDNLWAALGFCLQHPDEIEAAATLAQHLHAFWACRGPFGDIRRLLASLAESAPENSIARARLLWVAAVIALHQNDRDSCAELSEQSLRIATEAKDAEVVAWSLLVGAIPRWFDGDLAEAIGEIDSALALARLMHLDQVELSALDALCAISIASEDPDRAIEVGEQGLLLSKDRGELWMRGYLLNYLTQANWMRGDKQRAEILAREAVACKRALDDRHGLTIALETLAWIAGELGQHSRAARLLGVAEHARQESSAALMDLYRPQHEQAVSATRHGLGQTAYEAAFEHGRAMTISEGVAFAVEDKQLPKAAPATKPGSHAVLTSRQLDMARLVADGFSNKQIADRLFLSERTIETHITNILNKLGLSSRTQIIRWMTDLSTPGLAPPEERP